MARPRSQDARRRGKTWVYLSTPEREALAAYAAREGLSQSEATRQALARAVPEWPGEGAA